MTTLTEDLIQAKDEAIEIKTNEIRRLHKVCGQKDETIKCIADAGANALKLLHHQGFTDVKGGIVESLDKAVSEARQAIG